MATTRYHNAGSTDWGLAASWQDGVGGASGVPVSTDTLYFSQGADAVTGTMNQAAVDLQGIYESVGFTGSVGSAGTPLLIDVNQTSTGIFDKGGNGRWNISGTLYDVRCRKGYLGIMGGTTSNLTVYGGEVVVDASAVLNAKTVRVNGGTLTVNYKSETGPTLTINGGTVIMYRIGGAVTLNGGTLVMAVESSISATTSITQNGGNLDWRAGFCTTWTPLGGSATFANQTKPITITNAVAFKGTDVTNLYGGNGLAVTYSGGVTEQVPTHK